MFEVSAGQLVAGKYRIDGLMGSGGMGVVVAATHLELDQRVAIKFLRDVSPDAIARFQREARLLVRLKSSHVARVFDVGTLDDETPYIVMEHLDGEDLATVISARQKLPVGETVDYILQACEAVAEAHALGMVHRDLKPANLFLAVGPGGTKTLKVLDFGVSKVLDDRATGDTPRGGDLTHEGMSLGSPGYMSPEQITSARDVDERSDIFSLGALLYRLVAGTTPYRGKNAVSILASMATEGLTPVRTLAPEVPEEFAAIAERCLAQDKAARYPTVAHLAHALAPWATRRGRVLIEQILATLNVTFDGDALDATAAKSPKAAVPEKPAPAKPRALAIPQTVMIVAVTVVVVVAGSATCRALRSAPAADGAASGSSAITTPAPTPTLSATPTPTPAPPPTLAATEPTTAPAAPSLDPAPTSRPKITPTPLARPRGKR